MSLNKKVILMGNRSKLANLLWTHFSAVSKFQKVIDLNLAGYPTYIKTKRIPFRASLPRNIWAGITAYVRPILPFPVISENLFFIKSLTDNREALLADIQFDEKIENEVEAFIKSHNGKSLCAIHWRQGDYKLWEDGRFWVSPQDLQRILSRLKEKLGDVCFIICTDGERPEFIEVDYLYSPFTDPMADILLMSSCHCLVGSRSTFGAFAAWLGGIPHIEFGSASNIDQMPSRGFHTESIVDNEIEFTEPTT